MRRNTVLPSAENSAKLSFLRQSVSTKPSDAKNNRRMRGYRSPNSCGFVLRLCESVSVSLLPFTALELLGKKTANFNLVAELVPLGATSRAGLSTRIARLGRARYRTIAFPPCVPVSH